MGATTVRSASSPPTSPCAPWSSGSGRLAGRSSYSPSARRREPLPGCRFLGLASDHWGASRRVTRSVSRASTAPPSPTGCARSDSIRPVSTKPAAMTSTLHRAAHRAGTAAGAGRTAGRRRHRHHRTPRYWVELTGASDHAGARPMDLRRDPMAGAAEIISGVINTAHRMGRPAVTTVGRIRPSRTLVPAVPEKVTFTVDARHPDPAQRAVLYERHEATDARGRRRRDLDLPGRSPAISRAGTVRSRARLAPGRRGAPAGHPVHRIPSGAAHDAQQMARVARIAMIFVRSKDGRSHTPAEFTSVEDATAGIAVAGRGAPPTRLLVATPAPKTTRRSEQMARHPILVFQRVKPPSFDLCGIRNVVRGVGRGICVRTHERRCRSNECLDFRR